MDSSKELIIITGVSGAGKSSAMAFMEDAGYYCIDNMHVSYTHLRANETGRNLV